MRIDGRVRRSRGSVEVHTAQVQPIIGTPCEVPVPRSVTLRLNVDRPYGSMIRVPPPETSTNRNRSS